MQQFRNKLVTLINQNRTDPATTAKQLYSELSSHYNIDELRYYDKHIQTFEGIAALQDYKLYMSNFKSVGYLTISDSLNKAAQSIAESKGKSGRADHESPRIIYEKINANGKVDGRVGELISLKAHSSEQISSYFFIDDGLATRKRRRMLLDGGYKYIGIGVASHSVHEVVTIILLADKITELTEAEKTQMSKQSNSNFQNSAANRATSNDY